MPRKRAQTPKPKPSRRPKAPKIKNPPKEKKARRKKPKAALRPRGSLKRRMMARLIAVENERGEPREIPRDVDIVGRYTIAALSRYVAGVEGVLEARERAMEEAEAGVEARDAGVGVWVGGPGRGLVLGRAGEGEAGGTGRGRGSGRVGLSVRTLEEPEPELRPPATLTSLPPELREQIFRSLLVSPTPTVVHNAWATHHRRQAPRSLDPSVLRTCRLFYTEGMKVLYGENSFEYLVRDATAEGATPGGEEVPAEDEEGEDESDEEYSDEEYDDDNEPDVQVPEEAPQHDINIPRHGPLMRYLTIRTEANRSGQEYLRTAARAISVFATLSPIRARVHSLSLEVQPTYNAETGDFSFADWFEPGTELMRALVRLPCRFVEVVVLTEGGREVRLGVSREYGAVVRRARRAVDGIGVEERGEREARAREARARREYEVLMGVAEKIRTEGWAELLAGLNDAMVELVSEAE